MYQNSFGLEKQVHFNNEHEYYKLIGYLAKPAGTTSLVWEHNENQGAWGIEGRIQFFTSDTPFSNNLSYTAGNGGKIINRVNCNDFVKDLNTDHGFVTGKDQPISSIRATIPTPYLDDFEQGFSM